MLGSRPPVATRLVATALIATAAIAYADRSATAVDSKIRIVTLIPGPAACPIGTDPATLTFQRGMREAGYSTDDVSQYCYSSISEVPNQVREILATNPTVLLVWGSAVVAKAVKDATTTLPVVFADVPDPVKNGLVVSLAHPGGNMTGLTNVTEELVAKRIELLKEALPSLTRIAVLGTLTNPEQLSYFRVAQEAARRLHVEARLYPVETQAKLASAFSEMEADHMQALTLLPDAWFYPLRTEVVALAAKHRIPAIYGNTAFADAGGLFVYGVNLSSLNLKAIVYLDKILKGAKPGDLPVERPSQFDFIVNQRTARDIGVTVSAAALLRATKVVE